MMVAEDRAKVKFDFLDIMGALVLIDQGSCLRGVALDYWA